MRILHRVAVAAGCLLVAAPGCTPPDPAAGTIEQPIVTADAPKTSSEAGAREQAEREKNEQQKTSPKRP